MTSDRFNLAVILTGLPVVDASWPAQTLWLVMAGFGWWMATVQDELGSLAEATP